jgi:glycosyltransferase involved in cell wall biosynthesis
VLYNASDIYVSTSSEGFGLTVAEAIACGVPAVGLDYSAVPEVIGPAGVKVPVSGYVDNEYDHYWGAIDEDALSQALIRLVRKPAERRALGAQGPAHVRANFTWEEKAAQFVALVSEAVEEKAA